MEEAVRGEMRRMVEPDFLEKHGNDVIVKDCMRLMEKFVQDVEEIKLFESRKENAVIKIADESIEKPVLISSLKNIINFGSKEVITRQTPVDKEAEEIVTIQPVSDVLIALVDLASTEPIRLTSESDVKEAHADEKEAHIDEKVVHIDEKEEINVLSSELLRLHQENASRVEALETKQMVLMEPFNQQVQTKVQEWQVEEEEVSYRVNSMFSILSPLLQRWLDTAQSKNNRKRLAQDLAHSGYRHALHRTLQYCVQFLQSRYTRLLILVVLLYFFAPVSWLKAKLHQLRVFAGFF